MDFSDYTTQLLKTVLSEFVPLLVFFPLILIWMRDTDDVKKLSKRKKKSQKSKEKTAMGGLGVIAYFALVILAIIKVAPIIKDITGEHYDFAHGEYQTEIRHGNRYNGTTKWVILTTDDGEEVHLDFSKGIDMDDFPENGTYGTAVYAENSKYLLEFIPDELSDGK